MNVLFIPDYRKYNPYQLLLAKELLNKNIKVFFCDNYSFFSLIRFYVKSKFKLLHVHWPDKFILHDNALIMAIKASNFILQLLFFKILGVKIVWTVHNINNHEGTNLKFYRTILKFFSCLVDLHIIHSKHSVPLLESFSIKKIEVLKHPSYYGYYKLDFDEKKSRLILGIPENSFVYLFIGQIKEYKGVLDLIKAFKKINIENSCLLVAGLVSNQRILNKINIRKKNSSNIIFYNEFIRDDNLQLFFKASDVVVFPFKSILTSGSALLAQSFGKPIIIPEVDTLLENLNSSGVFTYKMNDLDDLAKMMKYIYNVDNFNPEDIKNNLKDWAIENSWERFSDKTSELYLKI